MGAEPQRDDDRTLSRRIPGGVRLAASLALALIAGAGTARAQMDSREGIALQNQILELRRDMQQLRTQGGGGAIAVAPQSGGSSSDLTAQLLQRVSQLEDTVRQLRGRLDEAGNVQQRQMEALDKRIGDLEFRAGGAATPGAAPSVAATPAAKPGSGGVLVAPPGVAPQPGATPGPAHRTPELALQDGNAALARRDYAASEASAREVLASGRGPRTTDAQYLLAQSLAGKRDYQGAAVAFDDAYARNPKGSRAPDSLLGLANSLTAINERKASCQTLDKLRVEFPTLRADLRPLAAAARQRASCG